MNSKKRLQIRGYDPEIGHFVMTWVGIHKTSYKNA